MVADKLTALANSLLKPINPSSIVILGFYTMLWGFWLIMPWAMFTDIAVYTVMASIAPEAVWGGVGAACGVFTTFGATTRRFNLLTIGSTSSFLFWLCLAIMFLLGDFNSPWWIAALMFSTSAAVIRMNLHVNQEIKVP